MPNARFASLMESAIVSFESLAFLFAEQADGDVPHDDVDGVAVVRFGGPESGALLVQLSGGVLPALSANMLGTDDTPPLETQQDALGEVANVICGNVLPRLHGATDVFHLVPPRSYPSWADAVEAVGQPGTVVAISLEGGRADVGLVVAN